MAVLDFLSKPLAPEEDVEFSHWYSNIAEKSNLSPDPDDPRHYYDYRAAHEAGAGLDERKHLPSEFKHDLHPNRFIDQGDGTFLDSKNNTYVSKSIVDETNMKRIMHKMLKGLPSKIK